MTNIARLNYASAGAVRKNRPERPSSAGFRVRIEEDSDGSWTVTDHQRSGATVVFRGEHEDAVKFANTYVNI